MGIDPETELPGLQLHDILIEAALSQIMIALLLFLRVLLHTLKLD